MPAAQSQPQSMSAGSTCGGRGLGGMGGNGGNGQIGMQGCGGGHGQIGMQGCGGGHGAAPGHPPWHGACGVSQPQLWPVVV